MLSILSDLNTSPNRESHIFTQVSCHSNAHKKALVRQNRISDNEIFAQGAAWFIVMEPKSSQRTAWENNDHVYSAKTV